MVFLLGTSPIIVYLCRSSFWSWSLVEILKLICWSDLKVITLVKELIPLGPFGLWQCLNMAKGTTDLSVEIFWQRSYSKEIETSYINNPEFWQKYCKVLVYVRSLLPSCHRTWLAIAKQSVFTSLSLTLFIQESWMATSETRPNWARKVALYRVVFFTVLP